jgi:hypothetical protein
LKEPMGGESAKRDKGLGEDISAESKLNLKHLICLMEHPSQPARRLRRLMPSIAEGRTSGGCGCVPGRCGKGGHGGDCTNARGKWGSNESPTDPKSNKTSADSVEKRNDSWMMNCNSCGWNDTHTSGYRSKRS